MTHYISVVRGSKKLYKRNGNMMTKSEFLMTTESPNTYLPKVQMKGVDVIVWDAFLY